MYYHCRPLKYVEYGKVVPYKEKDSWLMPAYDWLGYYCGYSPQIWLSRSTSRITGFKDGDVVIKKQKNVIGRKSIAKINNNSVLFGFENIKGFPVEYELWCILLNTLINIDSGSKEKINEILEEKLNLFYEWAEQDNDLDEDNFLKDWHKMQNFDLYLKKYLFVEKNQVVVPSLNLKAAKKIICKNEKQKKKLRHMGFIEDRITIKN